MKHLFMLVLVVGILTGCGGGADNPEEAEAIKTYLKDFSEMGVSWYSAIQDVTVKDDTVTVQTSLTSLDESAKGVCSGVSGYVFSNDHRSAGLNNIRVVGSGGEVLIDRQGISDSCTSQ